MTTKNQGQVSKDHKSSRWAYDEDDHQDHAVRCIPPLAKKGVVERPTSSVLQVIVMLTKGIYVANGVLYFKLSNAMEHVLTTKETSAKLQEWNYLGQILPNYKSV